MKPPLTIRWLIKHFTVIYGDANKQFLTLNLNIFCREKISLSGTPNSLPKIADLPIWAQEKITCMILGHCTTKIISTKCPTLKRKSRQNVALWTEIKAFSTKRHIRRSGFRRNVVHRYKKSLEFCDPTYIAVVVSISVMPLLQYF